MTILVFLMGVSLITNAAVGFIAWQAVAATGRERAAHEATRRDVEAMLHELQRIKQLAMPMPVSTKPMNFRVVIGNALVRYEREEEIKALAAKLEIAAA